MTKMTVFTLTHEHCYFKEQTTEDFSLKKKTKTKKNCSTSNASTEATRSPKKMVATALELHRCHFANAPTLKL
tara:strand:- start:253 stop:471 length:219 start_codon:yes stop_codon:yes gene_type:complete